MKSSEAKQLAWSPGPSILAVPLDKNPQPMSWEVYLYLLQQRINQIAQGSPNASRLYEQAWWDKMGEMPHVPMERHVQSAQFQEMLSNVHNLNQSNFPKQARNDPHLRETMETDWGIEMFLSDLLGG